MAKKLVEAITSMDEDFAQWYTDVVKKAELCDYTSVKGCMVIKPAGYAIWENIQNELDRRFKETGVQNVYMPMFIPESSSAERKRPRRRFCTGSSMGNTWWTGCHFRSVSVYVRLLRLCSVISIRKISIPTEICRKYTTSGVL